MSKGKKHIPHKLQPWIEARRKHRLSHAQVQMARELGLNPAKLGKIDNHHQEPWKIPLPDFIAKCYRKSFGRDQPLEVLTLEQWVARDAAKKAARRARKAAEKEEGGNAGEASSESENAEASAS